ncbi:MAG: hypothetical protein MJ168_06300 [Clostridia bacterium]|nr:hypothetical protein [Clostridia bacterium]
MKSNGISKLNKCGYGLFFGIALAVKMLLNMPFTCTDMTDPWGYLFYITEYSTIGFVPRALLGTVCGVFTDYISWKTIYIISLVAEILMIILAAFLFNKIMLNLPQGRLALFFFSCIFLLMADDLFYFFDTDHFGSIDVYFIIMTILAVAFAGNKKMRWLVPVLCTLCMMDYEGYVFAYMPLVGIVLLYYCFKEKSKSCIAVFALSCFAVIVSFLYFYAFFRQDMLNMVLCETPEEMTAVLSKHSDAEISWMIEQLYYFKGAGTFFVDGSWDIASTIIASNLVRLQCLPSALVMFGSALLVWIKVRKNEKEKNMKFIYLLCAIAPVASIPFQVFSEQMKYISYFAITQFILLVFFAAKEKGVRQRLEELESCIKLSPIAAAIPMCLLVFFRAIW